MPATLDTVLNLIWLGMSVSGVVLLLWQETRRKRKSSWHTHMRRLCAVLLCAVCLFPAVSSSDDLCTLAWLESHFRGHRGVGGGPADQSKDETPHHLYRVLQALDHWHAESVCEQTPEIRFLGTISLSRESFVGSPVPCRAGRAPPSA